MTVGRRVWASVGLVFVGLGFIGAFVPGMPTTVFLVLALYCFKRGSARFENWLLNHRVFGPTLRDWEKYRGMRAKAKTKALAVMWPCLSVSCLVLWQRPAIMAIVFLSGVFATWYILTRPTVPENAEESAGPEGEASTVAA